MASSEMLSSLGLQTSILPLLERSFSAPESSPDVDAGLRRRLLGAGGCCGFWPGEETTGVRK
ncbi:hypothetical protein HPP92_009437 [Vanilla planifolia]|uniref:Uncharacterized protein n=1 Tax=Vanilla planifolia TaxID=51239 RepID=A0A835V6M1_VANPL|nr:hypothetical protein HPP92_009437 [Vanilla planifolia]